MQTSFKLTPHVDPYTSQYDADQLNNGWFVPSMPDLNPVSSTHLREAKEQENPAQFLAEKEAEYTKLFANPYNAAKYEMCIRDSASLANLDEKDYATIGQGIKKILEEYAKEFFKNGKAKGKN